MESWKAGEMRDWWRQVMLAPPKNASSKNVVDKDAQVHGCFLRFLDPFIFFT